MNLWWCQHCETPWLGADGCSRCGRSGLLIGDEDGPTAEGLAVMSNLRSRREARDYGDDRQGSVSQQPRCPECGGSARYPEAQRFGKVRHRGILAAMHPTDVHDGHKGKVRACSCQRVVEVKPAREPVVRPPLGTVVRARRRAPTEVRVEAKDIPVPLPAAPRPVRFRIWQRGIETWMDRTWLDRIETGWDPVLKVRD